MSTKLILLMILVLLKVNVNHHSCNLNYFLEFREIVTYIAVAIIIKSNEQRVKINFTDLMKTIFVWNYQKIPFFSLSKKLFLLLICIISVISNRMSTNLMYKEC